ncbi:OGT1 [Auxenochlorella protothecoides x Auxenochlorella symbiontica]
MYSMESKERLKEDVPQTSPMPPGPSSQLPHEASPAGHETSATPCVPPADAQDLEIVKSQVLILLDQCNRAPDVLALLSNLPGQAVAARPDLICLRGRALLALGNKPLALAAYLEALLSHPTNIDALLGCASVYTASALPLEALKCLERARGLAPTRADVLQALANVLTDLGTAEKLTRVPGWRGRYEAALEACPSHAQAHYNLGVAAGEEGQAAEAAAHYRDAVRAAPACAEAWCNLGVVLRSQGKLEEAVAAYEHALAVAPNHDIVRVNLAVALSERGSVVKLQGKQEEAVALYERALGLYPLHGESMYNLGVAAMEAGQMHRAIFMYESAVRVLPACAEAHNNLGVVYREMGNIDRAVTCYLAALNARPNFPQGLNNLAVVYTARGQSEEALQLLLSALSLAPEYAEAWNNIGVLQRDVGASVEAISSYEKCLALDPDNRNAGQNRLLSLNYVYHGETDLICDAHRDWGQSFQRLHPRLPPRVRDKADEASGRKLRVGYISPDLFTHSVSYFAEAPLTHHNTATVELFVYNCCLKGDAKTERLKGVVTSKPGVWRDVATLSEAALAKQIREDKIDVLVELTGHTANNRLGTMAACPSPVQVTWIGYPNSTGLEAVQYRITDSICDPLDTTQRFTEQLVRLPGCFLCYTPAQDLPDVAPCPAASRGYVTFGSFNALAKQMPGVLQTWARILRAVPSARLVLKNKPFACDPVRQRYWQLFEGLGVKRHRVDLLPLAISNRDHMAQYGLVDIGLDPWPYAGTTTTAEALVMGVPCLTLAGRCHAHNVGVSLLTAVGLQEEWVAHDLDAYVAAAVRAAGDVPGLCELRSGLRGRVLGSALCDGPAFVQGLEVVFRGLWQAWSVEGKRTS